MKTILFYFSILTLGLSLNSCIKHEVIPPPTSQVDLNCYFVGYINGTQTEYTQNVIGYNCYNSNQVYNNPSPTLSNYIYVSEISSPQQNQKIRITFGPLQWDGGVSATPTLTMFNDFHSTNSGIQIPLMDAADMTTGTPGVQVEYWDSNGDRWETSTADAPGFVTFNTLEQDSDQTGDYSIFQSSFSVSVFRSDPNQGLLQMDLTNCQFTGWFKR